MPICGTSVVPKLFTPGAKIYTLVKFFSEIQKNFKSQIEKWRGFFNSVDIQCEVRRPVGEKALY
jgi:hypothetical protein